MDVKKIKHRPTVCIRHLIDEPRLRRRFQIHVLHPGRGNLSKPEIQKCIAYYYIEIVTFCIRLKFLFFHKYHKS